MLTRLVYFLSVLKFTAGLYFRNLKIAAQVTNHLSETTLVMQIHNDGPCPIEDLFDLQLPVTSFLSEMILTEEKTNCTFTGTFLPEEKAQAGFDGAVQAGDSAALIKSYAVGKVTLSLSMPANATSTLTITYTEVLSKESGKVRLQLPINLSGKKVEGDIKVSVSVQEPSGVGDMGCSASQHQDEMVLSPITVSTEMDKQMSILIPSNDEVVEGTFSTTITCVYTPNDVPNGVLLVNSVDRHFFYLYAPATPGVTAVHKAIHFVIDISGSMQGTRLQSAKQAFKYMIGLLSPSDLFSVSTFNFEVKLGAFGPSSATEAAIAAASAFVDSLAAFGGTNLHAAVVQGIKHAHSLLSSAVNGAAPLLLLLTDGQASSGITNGRQIVSDALSENRQTERRVPVYALALGQGADYELLQALTTTNSGDTLRVYEGFGDSIDQMQKFYEDNLKHILMRQVTVELQNATPLSNTDLTFPVLNAGSEIVVTGQLEVSTARLRNRRVLADLLTFGIRIQAIGPDGPVSITTTATLTLPGDSPRVSESITRMHAYKKVHELMRQSDADKFMGNGALAEANRAKALNITLGAGLLWPGLTSMLVVADETCKKQMQNMDACSTSPPPCTDCQEDGEGGTTEAAGVYGSYYGYSYSAAASSPSIPNSPGRGSVAAGAPMAAPPPPGSIGGASGGGTPAGSHYYNSMPAPPPPGSIGKARGAPPMAPRLPPQKTAGPPPTAPGPVGVGPPLHDRGEERQQRYAASGGFKSSFSMMSMGLLLAGYMICF